MANGYMPDKLSASVVTDAEWLKQRRTKIIATIGPASADADRIAALIRKGVDMFRLNMSHGDYSFHRRAYRAIRQQEKLSGTAIGVLADLCGPKIRTGVFADGGVLLREGRRVTVTTRNVCGDSGLIPCRYKQLPVDVKKGNRILLQDGLLELRVRRVYGTEIDCTVVRGGELRDNNGMHVPGVRLSHIACLTPKDRKDMGFALKLGVDFLALSFVRQASDVTRLRRLMRRHGKSDVGIIAKIELYEALAHAEAIVQEADAVMVARGDLGVELQPEQLPAVQKQLIGLARRCHKPVIVATQMLESMVGNPRPTRAEVTDVAHAVQEGADGVMLSAETAIGRYPVAAVQIMDRIARQTELHQWRLGKETLTDTGSGVPSLAEGVAYAAASLARLLSARAIIVFSRSGTSAAYISAVRPAAPILAITTDPDVQRRMVLHWGIVPLRFSRSPADPLQMAKRSAVRLGLARRGQYLLIIGGFHADPEHNAPFIRAVIVD